MKANTYQLLILSRRMSTKIISDLRDIYLFTPDIVEKVILTVRYIKKNTNNLSILKYLYTHYQEYNLEFIKYLLMTMEESAITGIHMVKKKEYSNSDLLFRISNSEVKK